MSAKPTTTTRNEELKGQSLLVRTVAATLSVKLPSPREIIIRGALLRRAVKEISGMPSGLLIRFYEAACDCDFPDADVVSFRLACARILAKVLNLAEYKEAAQAKP